MQYIIYTTIFAFLLYITFLLRGKTTSSISSENETFIKQIAEKETQIKAYSESIVKLREQNVQFSRSITSLEEKLNSAAKENSNLQTKVAQFEAMKEQAGKRVADQIVKLGETSKALENEYERLRKTEEERQARLLSDKNRMWKEHEIVCLAKLRDLCSQPEYNFKYYDNTHLPSDFDGSFAPDFFIEFLGQYIIFDAKTSFSKDLPTYIKTSVKDTVRKIKSSNVSDKIYSCVYFLIPSLEIASLKEHVYHEDAYTFFVISQETVASLFNSFKRIQGYQLAEHLNPNDRESIIKLIAAYDSHINYTNALNIGQVVRGVQVLDNLKSLPEDFSADVINVKRQIQHRSITKSDLKRLTESRDAQITELKNLSLDRSPMVEIESTSSD